MTDLGRMPYAEAFARQRKVHAQVVAGQAPTTLMLVEHDPVITVSRRRAAAGHVLADESALAKLGIDVQPTDRGGDVTYHGPGQLVAYPIVRLNDYGLNLGRYMRLLEQVVIDTVAVFGVPAGRVDGATGVWVEAISDFGFAISDLTESGQPRLPSSSTGPAGSSRPAKLAALGVRVSRNVTMHGLALNVTTDLSHFETIVPCGLSNRNVTSLQQLLGDTTPPMQRVKEALTRVLDEALSALCAREA